MFSRSSSIISGRKQKSLQLTLKQINAGLQDWNWGWNRVRRNVWNKCTQVVWKTVPQLRCRETERATRLTYFMTLMYPLGCGYVQRGGAGLWMRLVVKTLAVQPLVRVPQHQLLLLIPSRLRINEAAPTRIHTRTHTHAYIHSVLHAYMQPHADTPHSFRSVFVFNCSCILLVYYW